MKITKHTIIVPNWIIVLVVAPVISDPQEFDKLAYFLSNSYIIQKFWYFIVVN